MAKNGVGAVKFSSLSSEEEERAGVRRQIVFQTFNPLTPTLSPPGRGEGEVKSTCYPKI
jgi:hypothetical protein